jgi:hypothetical protein
MNPNLYALENLFIRLQGTQIVHFSFNQGTLRLQIKTPVASQLLPGSETVHLVIGGCHKLFYLSYNQIQENRVALDKPELIFDKGLQIQGIELRNRDTTDKLVKEGFIVYCNSFLHDLEAGELHFTATDFQLYDQEFGLISFETFLRAAGELNTNS